MAIKIEERPGDELYYIHVEPPITYKAKKTRQHFFMVFSALILITSAFLYTTNLLQTKLLTKSSFTVNAQNTSNNIKTASQTDQLQLIGFYPSWKVAEQSPISPDLNQIIYFGINATGSGSLVTKDDESKITYDMAIMKSDYFHEVMNSSHQKNTKVTIAIKNFNIFTINLLRSNPQRTTTLAKDIATFVKENGFDGANLDFEYFSYWDDDFTSYITYLLQTINSELKKENPNYTLSLDVNAGVVLDDKTYDFTTIANVVDQVILMGYDYSRVDSTNAGPVAPLYGNNQQHSISRSLISLFGKIPTQKIILAVPLYGYRWKTVDTSFKSKTIANTGEIITYEQLQNILLSQKGIEQNWDIDSQTPWLYYQQKGSTMQVYFDNAQSLAKKKQFVEDQQLGGIAAWAIGYEGQYHEIWNALETNK